MNTDLQLLINKGEYYQAEGLTERALEMFDQALKVSPTAVNGLLNRANLLLQLGRAADALSDLYQAVRLAPFDPESHILLAQCLSQTGQTREALAECEQTLKLYANWCRAYQVKGDVLHQLGDSEAALKCYRRAREISPETVEYHLAIIENLFNDSRYEEANSEINAAMQRFSHNGWLYFWRAEIRARLGELEWALSDYEKAVCYASHLLKPRWHMARVLQRLNRLHRAIKLYGEIRREYPENSQLCCELAECYWQVGKIRHALIAYVKAIKVGTPNVNAYLGAAALLVSLGQNDDAISHYDRAVEIEPHNAEIYARRGALLLNLDRLAEAERDINRSLSINPDDVETFLARAEIRSRRGDSAGAVADLAMAVRLSAGEVDIQIRWLRAMAATGVPHESLRILEKMLDHNQDANLWLLRGDLLHECGRVDEARGAYNKVHSRRPDLQEPLFRLAELEMALQNYPAAADYYTRAIALLPTDPIGYLLRAGLYRKMAQLSLAAADEKSAIALRRNAGSN